MKRLNTPRNWTFAWSMLSKPAGFWTGLWDTNFHRCSGGRFEEA